MKKFYITTPIYYASGKPHIGHLYTTIAADIFARYYRLKLGDENVFFLTGTDEHGSKIKQEADKHNLDPKSFCDKISQIYKNVFSDYNISYNKFIRTTDPEHEKFVQEFVEKIYRAGDFYQAEYEGKYCVSCEKFITEKELIDGKCPDHLIEPQIIKETNWFFKLQKYLPKIKTLIESNELKILPESSKKEVLGLIAQGIPDFSISRDKDRVQWGIELPWDKTQLVYVWCDALTNYLSTEPVKNWWPAQLQLMGRDILKFHALYWPAMLMSAGYDLPEIIFAHGFFTVNGQKMSKTIGNVIDPVDLLSKFGSDAAKYLILSQFPFGNDGDIQKDKFVNKYNSELANGLGNLFNRVLALIEKYFDSKIPQKANIKEFCDLIQKSWEKYIDSLENNFRLDECLNIIRSEVNFCDKFISDNELWDLVKKDKELSGQYLYSLLEVLAHISVQILPFMPNIAQKMHEQLNYSIAGKRLEDLISWGQLKENSQIKKKQVLFSKI